LWHRFDAADLGVWSQDCDFDGAYLAVDLRPHFEEALPAW